MFSIKRVVERAVERALGAKQYNQDVGRVLEDFAGKLTIHSIANGYLITGHNTRPTYCADHVAVAEFIVAHATRSKMGLTATTQMDLFENAASAGKFMSANSIPYSGTIGKLDGHVLIKSKPDYL